MEIPRDPAMLLSFVNLKLRDYYDSLDAMCEDMGLSRKEIEDALAAIDYVYDEKTNSFS